MDKKEDWKLIEGSRYKIISIGGRDSSLETEGMFQGYATIGIEEAGLVIELCKEQKEELKNFVSFLCMRFSQSMFLMQSNMKEKMRRKNQAVIITDKTIKYQSTIA